MRKPVRQTTAIIVTVYRLEPDGEEHEATHHATEEQAKAARINPDDNIEQIRVTLTADGIAGALDDAFHSGLDTYNPNR